MPRVISLIASATEIVCALGCEHMLVGRSHECDHPASISGLPICTEAKLDASAPSAEIDRAVKAMVADALSVYRVHSQLLGELRPDVVITQTQCEVCAVSLRDVERAVSELAQSPGQVVSLAPQGLTDVWRDIEHVAQVLGVAERGKRLVADLEARVEQIAARASGVGERPSLAAVEWTDPLMAAGNWVPELVELAGGNNLFGEAGGHAPWMTWDQLVAADPDVIAFMPCGFDIPRTRQELGPLTGRAGWAGLKAVRRGRVYLTDGNQYFNRPGPRLVESLEILAEILHPEKFGFGHQGTGWVALSP